MTQPAPGRASVFVERTGRRIQPFDDLVDETPIQNRPLADWQTEAFRQAGLTRIEELRPPCLVVPDTLFANGEALRAFVAAAAGQDAVLVLRESRFGQSSTPVQAEVTRVAQGWRFERIRFVSGQDATPLEIVLDPDEVAVDVPMPQQYFGGARLSFGVPRRLVMTLHHWVHILWANQLAASVELRTLSRWTLIRRVLWAMLRARSFNKWKVLGRLNELGPGCDIHPSAVVEGSILGRGVVVGPHARVAFSRIGDGAIIMAGAYVEMSVVGAGCIVADQCLLRSCVLYPGAAASQAIMQQSILGKNCVTTKGGGTLDLNFDQELWVQLDGRMHNTGLRYLGSAYGHRARIGTGIYLAAGRTVPNDYILVRDPRQILSVIPPGLAGEPASGSGARLRPLRLSQGLRGTANKRAGQG